MNKEFWQGKKVLITGHTGFKGSWLSLWLHQWKAELAGVSLAPDTHPALFELANVAETMNSQCFNLCDSGRLDRFVLEFAPEIVIHLAAQSLVRYSYDHPVETYSTNVIGSLNILEACRKAESVKVVLMITTDKCYQNNEWNWGYREDDRLGGYDPYSSSKACCELLVESYRNSFLNPAVSGCKNIGVATARAGNVIGGGDWAKDRVIPDLVRAFSTDGSLFIRSPTSIRPWQHVLEPLGAYLLLCEKLYGNPQGYSEAWNIGPDSSDAKSVEWVVKRILQTWGRKIPVRYQRDKTKHEAHFLKLDCGKIHGKLGWSPVLNVEEAISLVVEWHRALDNRISARDACIEQITNYTAKLNV